MNPSTEHAAARPLDGLKVLDFSRVLAGPYCTALLADLGADVLKIESPGGDDYRHIGPFFPDGASAVFESVNRGKRSAVLDLGTADGRRVVHALATQADVVVENFRPGVAARLGIGFDELAAINPRLVYLSISGFGQDGPNAARPAYDVIMQALSGIMAVTGGKDGPPTLIGESVADITSGLFGSWAILAALVERSRTERGRYIDLAMFDAMIALQPTVVARMFATGTPPRRAGNRHPASAPFGIYAAADGDFALAILNNKLFATFAAAIGKPDLARDPRFLDDARRIASGDVLAAEIEAWSRALTVAQVVAELAEAGVPAGEVNDMTTALASAQARHRPPLQPITTIDAPAPRLSPQQPARFRGTPTQATRRAPALGADTDAVIAAPGLAWPTSRRSS